jgi:hypothetical protein
VILESFENLTRSAGAAPYRAKERKIDQAMQLLGLTYRPSGGDVPTVYYTEAVPPRLQDKRWQIQDAMPGFVSRGGDATKIQPLLQEFEREIRLATTEWEIYYRRSSDGGRTWEPEIRLTNAPGLSHRPSLVALGDDLYVAWWDGRTGDNEIYLKHSADGGRSWGADLRVTQSPGDSIKPSLALTRDFLHLVWLDTKDGNRRLCYRRAVRPIRE